MWLALPNLWLGARTLLRVVVLAGSNLVRNTTAAKKSMEIQQLAVIADGMTGELGSSDRVATGCSSLVTALGGSGSITVAPRFRHREFRELKQKCLHDVPAMPLDAVARASDQTHEDRAEQLRKRLLASTFFKRVAASKADSRLQTCDGAQSQGGADGSGFVFRRRGELADRTT